MHTVQAIGARDPATKVPLTGPQQRLWRFQREAGTWLSLRSTTRGLRILGALDLNVLTVAMNELRRQHESLRTRVVDLDSVPHHVVDPCIDTELQIVDLTQMEAGSALPEVRRQSTQLIQQRVDWAVGPLFAATVFGLSPSEHVLIFALDHVIADGTSLQVLETELWRLYSLLLRNEPVTSIQGRIQYGDYAMWEVQRRAARIRAHESYWRERLAGAPRLRFPESIGIRGCPEHRGGLLHLSFGPELTAEMRAFADRHRLMVPLVGLTVYLAVACRWCERQEAVVAVLANSRYRPELRQVIGYIASFVHLRVKIETSDSFADVLKRVAAEFYRSISHDTLDQLPVFMPEWEFGATDLYFNWLSDAPGRDVPLGNAESLSVEPFETRLPEPIGFLPIFCDSGNEIRVSIYHIPDIYPAAVVQRWWDNICRFASELVSNPASAVPRFE